MGLTIANHKHSIDMGYGGFMRLRKTISTLLGCDEFAAIYAEMCNPHQAMANWDNEEEYWADYDKRAIEICERNELDEDVIDFLYRSDADNTSFSVKTCRHLWWVIKDYDDNVIYGYAGRPDRAMFKDFKRIVKECVDDQRVMRIY